MPRVEHVYNSITRPGYTFGFGLHTALFRTGESALISVIPEVINSKHLQHKDIILYAVNVCC